MSARPNAKTDMVVVTSSDATEEANLEESIGAYLADQAELEKDRPPDAMSKLLPPSNPDEWDFSPFPESDEPLNQKEIRKRRGEHLNEVGMHARVGKESYECVDEVCKVAEHNVIQERTDDSSSDYDYREYSIHSDTEYSTSLPPDDNEESRKDTQIKRLRHNRKRRGKDKSKVKKNVAPLSRKTSILLSGRQLNAMEEHISPRALPPNLPPEILEKIKAMKHKSTHGSRPQGLPRVAPPGTSSAGAPPKRPSFPVMRPTSSRKANGMQRPASPGAFPARPDGPRPGVPPGIPPGNSPGMPSGIPPGISPGTPSGVPPGIPPAGIPPGVFPGMPPGISPGIPPGMPPGIPPGMPPGVPQGMPPAMSLAMPPGLPPGLPAGLPVGPAGSPPAESPPPPPPGPAPGLPPSLPAGLSAPSGGPAGPLPAPVEDYGWLKASLKAAVDKEAVSAALEKAVVKQSGPARLLGAVRPRLAAAFSVQYSAADCSQVAAFKGAFPGQATSSVCLICQPGGQGAAAAPAAPSGPPIPPQIQALMEQAAANQAAQAGMSPGAPSGRLARRRRQFVARAAGGGRSALRWRRQTGRCVPICELRDLRVKCTSTETSHSLAVVGTAVVSPASSFHKCSAKCEREWELLLQFAAAERLRAYFLSSQEVRAGASASRPVPHSWQVERVMRCGREGLTLQHGLCYPAGNWAVRALLAAQNSNTLGLAVLAGAGGLALLIAVGLLLYFKGLPAFCGKLCKGGGKKIGGGGGGGGGGGEKLGEGGAGTVEFVDEPPPPPPPA